MKTRTNTRAGGLASLPYGSVIDTTIATTTAVVTTATGTLTGG